MAMVKLVHPQAVYLLQGMELALILRTFTNFAKRSLATINVVTMVIK